MGKGDQKSRRGKIIIGSTGVRRPKNKKKAVVAVEAVVKVKKVAEKAKAEPKAKAKVAEPIVAVTPEVTETPAKAVKKAVSKPKTTDTAK
jgi:30S ribosomal protein S31